MGGLGMKLVGTVWRFLQSWGPALLTMLGIFVLSSQPSIELPHFGWADAVIKKSGHVIGYGLLGLCYWRGFGWRTGWAVRAWALAVAYGMTDELHQMFVPGRQASAWDVILFDASGAAIALWLAHRHAVSLQGQQVED